MSIAVRATTRSAAAGVRAGAVVPVRSNLSLAAGRWAYVLLAALLVAAITFGCAPDTGAGNAAPTQGPRLVF